MSELFNFQSIISVKYRHQRLDHILAQLLPNFSRTKLQQWIEAGYVTVNGNTCRARDKMQGGEEILIQAHCTSELSTWQAQDIALTIIYEDEEILIINKPIDMVVHPAAGNISHTLANALLHYLPALAQLPRAGIVHRLDKNTSGLLVVAKTLAAQHALVVQLQTHQMYREYIALVNGVLISGGTINKPLGRDPQNRQKRAVIINGKSAVTHYRIIQRFRAHTLVKVLLETGRTHQIRVHFSYLGHPLLGDKTYGARPIIPKQADAEVIAVIRNYSHQALHAKRLHLQHPISHEMLHFTAPIPQSFQHLIDVLQKDANEFSMP